MSFNTLDYKLRLNDGNVIPQFLLGTPYPGTGKNFETLPEVLRAAILENGFRAIDTAWYYGCEPIIGEVLKDVLKSGKVKREELFISTKVWPSMWNKAEASIQKSLKDLGLDYVDMALQHWPVCCKAISNCSSCKRKVWLRVSVSQTSTSNI